MYEVGSNHPAHLSILLITEGRLIRAALPAEIGGGKSEGAEGGAPVIRGSSLEG